MTLTRDEISAGMAREYAEFTSMIRTLGDEEWSAPTRCEGWTVADVAAHVSGQIDAVANLRFEELAGDDAVDRQVQARRGQGPEEIADELQVAVETAAPMVAGFDDDAWSSPAPEGAFAGTLGDGVLALWHDTWVHADDIRDALGRPPDRGPGLEAAVARLVDQIERDGRGSFTLALEGMAEIDVNGGGRRVEGDPYDFVMVATGRKDPATLGFDETVNIYG